MDSNGTMITGTRWLLISGNAASTRDLNIPPTVLYIACTFNAAIDAGTYICSPNSMTNNPSRDTVVLYAGGEYF